MEICNHLDIELFRIPYPPKPLNTQPTRGQQSPNVSQSSSTSTSHDRNGTNNSPVSFHHQSGSLQQPSLTKRQTRSSKRHVVAH